MNNYTRLLQIAVAAGAIIGSILLLQVKADFSYFSSPYTHFIGIPFFVVLVIIAFFISTWSSTKFIIYGTLSLILVLELIPLGLFIGNSEYPSSYYINPQGKIVLSYFPGNVFQGETKGKVDKDVIAAFDWQNGHNKDTSGRLLRFYRIKPDGNIVVFSYPVENGEVLHPLDNTTLEKYVSQQKKRVEEFLDEGDLAKSKEILSTLTELDSSDDTIYRLSRKISQREEQIKAEKEEAEAAKLQEENQKQISDNDSLQTTAETNEPVAENNESTYEDKMRDGENNSPETFKKSNMYDKPVKRYRSSYRNNVDYSYPQSDSYSAPSQYYSQPNMASVNTYNPPTQTYTVQPKSQPAQVTNYPTQKVYQQPVPSYTRNIPAQTNKVQSQDHKKGMSLTKKILIGAGIIGGGIVVEEIIRRKH